MNRNYLPIIPFTDTISDKRTVMVKSMHTVIADFAVGAVNRTVNQTCMTEFI